MREFDFGPFARYTLAWGKRAVKLAKAGSTAFFVGPGGMVPQGQGAALVRERLSEGPPLALFSREVYFAPGESPGVNHRAGRALSWG
jgi:hypothetical protein